MTSINASKKAGAKESNLLKKINRKQNRPSPSLNPVSSVSGFSGENTYRRMEDGSVHHGMKFGDEWFYRRYTKSGEDEWDITNLIGVERIQSLIFKGNLYSGKGWQIAKDDKGDYTLEIDNIITRKAMTIWELIINKLRASNGTFIVGSSAKVLDKDSAITKTGSYTYDIVFEADNEIANTQPFMVGDIISCKRFWLREEHPQAGTEQIVAQVTNTSSSNLTKITVTIQRKHSFGEIKGGMDFVRVASSVASRQGLVVLSSDGNDNIEDGAVVVPFIDVYHGLETYENFLSALGGDSDFIKVRMGRLDQLTGNTDEFGIWTNAIHIIGTAVEGVNNIHSGTRAEFNALTSTETDAYHNGDVWIMTDENNNILTWNPDGVDVIGLGDDAWGNRQISLTVGIEYTIKTYVSGDDFINVGASSNTQGVTFRATGIDPTVWDASTLTQYWVDRTNETIINYRSDVLSMINENSFLLEDKNIINILERNHAFVVLGKLESNHTQQLAEAVYFGVSSTAYKNAYDALYLYMHTTITWNNNDDYKTGVDGAVWIVKWGNIFDELADLKEAITNATYEHIPVDIDGKMKNTPNTGTAGLYLGSVNMGYHDGGTNWLTYMDNTGNFYLGGTGGKLRWNSSTNALYIAGEIHITNPSDINSNAITNGAGWTDDTTANSAQNTANSNALDIFTNQYGFVDKPPSTVSGAGLYLGSTHLGYFNGSIWTTYMSNTGNFYLGGTSGALQWNGSVLDITGSIHVSNASTVRSDINVSDGADVTVDELEAGVTINEGGITLSTYGTPTNSPKINLSKTTWNSTSSGFWLGYKSATSTKQVFHIGDASHSLLFDAETGDFLIDGEYVGGEITGGIIVSAGFTMASNGYLNTTGKTAYKDITAGVFLGYDSGESGYAFDVGDSSNFLRWSAGDGLTTKNLKSLGTLIGSDQPYIGLIDGDIKLVYKSGYGGEIQFWYTSGGVEYEMGQIYSSSYGISLDAGSNKVMIASGSAFEVSGGDIRLLSLPTSDPAQNSELFTQTASQLGGSGTTKVLCVSSL